MSSKRSRKPSKMYNTRRGAIYWSTAEHFLNSKIVDRHKGKIQLLLTSPPFPLNRKKKYGNLRGIPYLKWLASFAPAFRKLLAPGGSIVLELGNAWERGRPVMSTLALEALLEFKREGKLKLVQQFVVHNPARLPSPAQWVNVERIRVKDSFTHIWWLAPSDRPYADNRSVLTPYSAAMRDLLKSKRYNSGPRPSEHHIGKRSFLKDNGGAIASNVLSFSNTSSNDAYQEYCRKNGLKPHPARMQRDVAAFFVKFLTRKGDTVLDPFAGSNTTGAVAETLRRKWVSIEANRDYIRGSRGRFSKNSRGFR